MQLTTLDRLLWAFSLTGHCLLLAVLLLRRRAASFPIFTTFISVNILKTLVLYFTLRLGSVNQYFYTYWTLAILDLFLQLAVAYEVATHVFRPLGAWAPDVRRSFASILSIGLLFAIALTWLASPPTRTLRMAIVLRGNFFDSIVISEIFVAMIVLSVTMGLPWRTHVARIAQGLGVYALFGIFSDAALNYFGSAHGSATYQLVSQLEIELYVLCLSYWVVTLALKEPAPRKLPEQLHQQLRILQSKAALMLRHLRLTGSPS
jgi:hypothetical protein